MNGGYFTRQYAVWRLTTTPGQYGEPVEEWNKIADAPGRAYPTRLTDTFAAARQQGVITWTFATAADIDVLEGDEVRFDGRSIKVLAVSVTSTGRRLEALCEEVR